MFIHIGIYFTEEHIKLAIRDRDREPFKSAWSFLRDHQPADELETVQLDGLRYRFDGDRAAVEHAARRLEGILQTDYSEGTSYGQAVARTLALAQCLEMVRDHPVVGEEWLDAFAARVGDLNQAAYDGMPYHEHIWMAAARLIAGIVLEDQAAFQSGVDAYQQVVSEGIRPEGHIPGAVDDPDRKGDGLSLERQLLAVEGLILMAEAASHVGVDLWGYNNRGVSVMTAATYLIYYYYYPEKWRWDEGLELDPTQRLFRQHGGFLEMLNRHTPPKALKLLLDELRPIYDLYGGGLTTLSHGVPARRGLFG